MKYLKTYEMNNLRISQNVILPVDIIQEIKEICLELTDVGFVARVGKASSSISNPVISYTVLDICRKHSFTLEEISEVVDRIRDYLSDKGYEISPHWAYTLSLHEPTSLIRYLFTKK